MVPPNTPTPAASPVRRSPLADAAMVLAVLARVNAAHITRRVRCLNNEFFRAVSGGCRCEGILQSGAISSGRGTVSSGLLRQRRMALNLEECLMTVLRLSVDTGRWWEPSREGLPPLYDQSHHRRSISVTRIDAVA